MLLKESEKYRQNAKVQTEVTTNVRELLSSTRYQTNR